MAPSEGFSERRTRWANRLHARAARYATPATGWVTQPEPRTVGSFARGRQLLAGNFQFSGYLVEDKNASIWALDPPSPDFAEEIHGFAWLDDMAAVGDFRARKRAQDWIIEWCKKYGNGSGAGWTPDLTGRRVIRWVNHALFVLNGMRKRDSELFFQVISRQTTFLARRWSVAVAGLPRIEALTGLIYAGLALSGKEEHVPVAVRALSRDCDSQIDAEGGIPTRNPEELLEVFTLLNWAAAALSDAGQSAEPSHMAAIERIAPTLRALRHSDGGLARYHGGGRGFEGRLDQALANAGVRAASNTNLSMGFARMHGGRTTVIVDAATPPDGLASYNAHASTLAFEVTSGRRPLIVNCGSGAPFGEEWRRAGRATPSHSTLGIDGYSSARLAPKRLIGGHQRELLVDVPRDVRLQQSTSAEGMSLSVAHDGYRQTHGLTHARQFELSTDGRGLTGVETLATLNDADAKQFDQIMDRLALQGVPYQLRFHLHPEVDAAIDMGGAAVSLALRSGEIWVFRHDGKAKLTLEPSVFLEKTRIKPRSSKQIVLSGRAMEYASRVSWTLAKAQDTPNALRDLERDDLPPL